MGMVKELRWTYNTVIPSQTLISALRGILMLKGKEMEAPGHKMKKNISLVVGGEGEGEG